MSRKFSGPDKNGWHNRKMQYINTGPFAPLTQYLALECENRRRIYEQLQVDYIQIQIDLDNIRSDLEDARWSLSVANHNIHSAREDSEAWQDLFQRSQIEIFRQRRYIAFLEKRAKTSGRTVPASFLRNMFKIEDRGEEESETDLSD